jgi:hypothetical protein
LRVQDLGFGFEALVFSVMGSGLKAEGEGCRLEGVGLRAECFRILTSGSDFMA